MLSPSGALERLRPLAGSPWFPVALVGLYLVRPFLAWPITLCSALVGLRYGVALGLPLALVGAVATSFLPYAVARRTDTTGGVLGRLTDGSRRYFGTAGDLRGLVAARLAPTPAEPVSAAAGAAGLSARTFALGTAIGELPWTVAAVVAGASVEHLDASLDPWLLAAGATLALALLLAPAYRYWRQGSGAVQNEVGN